MARVYKMAVIICLATLITSNVALTMRVNALEERMTMIENDQTAVVSSVEQTLDLVKSVVAKSAARR